MSDNRGKVDLSRFDNSWYEIGAGGLKQVLWYYTNALFFISPLFPFRRIKPTLLRAFGAKVGKGVVIHPGVNIKFPWKLTIGDHCWIGQRAWLDNTAPIKIGSHVVISQGALIIAGSHNFKKVDFSTMVEPVVLEDGCWIGARAIVTMGATIGTHAVLSAGSMTSKNLAPYGIYRGNPAEKVSERTIT